MKAILLVLLFTWLSLLAGCSTTGDPKSGGLFAWRESQAQQRQDQLHADITAAEAETRRLADEYDYLKGARNAAADRVAGLRQLVDALLAENAKLRAGIERAIAEESRANTQLVDLQARLQTYDKSGFDSLQDERGREQWAQQLQQQNREMRHALGW